MTWCELQFSFIVFYDRIYWVNARSQGVLVIKNQDKALKFCNSLSCLKLSVLFLYRIDGVLLVGVIAFVHGCFGAVMMRV